MDLKPLLERLVAGGDLSADEASAIAAAISDGLTNETQVGALLALLAAKGESPEVVFGFARELRKRAIKVEWTEAHRPPFLVDVVGTGGDGHASVNISTAAAIVASAFEDASGPVFVAKHGSVSVSSRSGSADVLLSLGIPHLKQPSSIADCVSSASIAFMFAPAFHPALKAVVPIRKALKMRTIFNILGPLLNPAGAERLVLGVFKPSLLKVYAEAVAALGVKHALIVHGHVHGSAPGSGGADEFTPCGPSEVVEVKDGKVLRDGESFLVDSASFCGPEGGAGVVARCSIADLEGGTPDENATIIRAAFGDAEAEASLPLVGESPGRLPTLPAIRDAIALNAGACLYVSGKAASIEEGFFLARKVMEGGKSKSKLEEWSRAAKALAVKEEEMAAC